MSLKKTASITAPHATFTHEGWTWRVLKTYKSPKGEQADQYARWFCHVSSPMCPEGELGDVYVRDVIYPRLGSQFQSHLVQATDEFCTAYERAVKEVA